MKAIVSALLIGALAACGGGGSSSSGDNTAFCSALKSYDSQYKSTEPSGAQIVAVFNELSKKAPSDIKSDIDALASFAGYASDHSADLSNMSDSSQQSMFSSAQSASDRLAKYAKDKCGIDIGGSSSKFSEVGSSIN